MLHKIRTFRTNTKSMFCGLMGFSLTRAKVQFDFDSIDNASSSIRMLHRLGGGKKLTGNLHLMLEVSRLGSTTIKSMSIELYASGISRGLL
ncbi:hypothetical protein LIPSTDRAFT_74988 [Lipomyces starkeyi NRRL Y-11557]|uniref:Uncharacterized protein n=1 Tax=Lipomyces starkeyi NRRL Y-11557 TaxID=675824 RepID=A0A1E3PX51_LIPST|nr:hypothetical protein LIPSTDRAFT_74988 [Lipomyces starkeyi NRRL Y-11557]